MKKFIALLLLAVTIFSASSTVYAKDFLEYEEHYSHPLTGESINVYNWGEYISDGSEGSLDINAEFTRITGIKVNYTNFASNEDMYSKITKSTESYDIIIPSDYMIQRLMNEGYLQKLNFDNIPNYKYIDPKYKDLPYDPKNEYSVPYTVGMVGLIYNKKMLLEKGFTEEEMPTSWETLWDERLKNNILMFNNPRDAFAISHALICSYEDPEGDIDLNPTDVATWEAAYEKLLEQKPLVKSYVMDEIFNKMENNNAIVAPYYAGDFLSMKDNNDDLEFVYPKEGVNFFVDAMCIPKSAKNKEAAELYINFMLDPYIALQNAEYICYASPHTEVVNNPEYSLYQNQYLYSDDIKNDVFTDLPKDTLNVMSNYWMLLKISGNDYRIYYVIFFAILAGVIGLTIYRSHKRKKMEYE